MGTLATGIVLCALYVSIATNVGLVVYWKMADNESPSERAAMSLVVGTVWPRIIAGLGMAIVVAVPYGTASSVTGAPSVS